MNGRTLLTTGTASEDGSLYHDYGFIDLAPGDILADWRTYTAEGQIISSSDGTALSSSAVGSYIYIDGQWRSIVAWNDDEHTSVLLSSAVENDGSYDSPIVTMNKIVITPDDEMALTRLNFIYQPTFA